jgi:hypothetical protein
MQMDFSNQIELPPSRPLLKLSTCEDFFDRDYDTLIVDVENRVLRFAWDIATPETTRREVRLWRGAALAWYHDKPIPKLTEDDVYKLILPNRDLRSTELERILSCTHQHVYALAPLLVVTQAPLQADGPHSYTKFSRASVVAFLRSRRLS